MTEVYKDLYQFTFVVEPVMVSIHQYLLLAEEPILVQTGAVLQAEETVPKLKALLSGKEIKYILVSHFESDECGGLSLVLKEYPNAVVVCSEVTARQLLGFGMVLPPQVKTVKPGEEFSGSGFAFRAIAYPSEMHLWEGVLFYETTRGILFSSDLMFVNGENHGQVIERSWGEAVTNSGAGELPSASMGQALTGELEKLPPEFVASGHGPCIKVV